MPNHTLTLAETEPYEFFDDGRDWAPFLNTTRIAYQGFTQASAGSWTSDTPNICDICSKHSSLCLQKYFVEALDPDVTIPGGSLVKETILICRDCDSLLHYFFPYNLTELGIAYSDNSEANFMIGSTNASAAAVKLRTTGKEGRISSQLYNEDKMFHFKFRLIGSPDRQEMFHAILTDLDCDWPVPGDRKITHLTPYCGKCKGWVWSAPALGLKNIKSLADQCGVKIQVKGFVAGSACKSKSITLRHPLANGEVGTQE